LYDKRLYKGKCSEKQAGVLDNLPKNRQCGKHKTAYAALAKQAPGSGNRQGEVQ